MTCIEDQPGQDPTTSTEDATLHWFTYIPALYVNHLPIFMILLIHTLLPSSPESCISHILITLSEASQVVLVVKNWPVNPGDVKDRGFFFLGQEDLLEKCMATNSSILAWKMPWKGKPDGLQSIGSQRTGHD